MLKAVVFSFPCRKIILASEISKVPWGPWEAFLIGDVENVVVSVDTHATPSGAFLRFFVVYDYNGSGREFCFDGGMYYQ